MPLEEPADAFVAFMKYPNLYLVSDIAREGEQIAIYKDAVLARKNDNPSSHLQWRSIYMKEQALWADLVAVVTIRPRDLPHTWKECFIRNPNDYKTTPLATVFLSRDVQDVPYRRMCRALE